MTKRIRQWTTEDLELYHDDELNAAQRSELNEALRCDPGLRDRLATVRRVDDMLRGALLDETPRRRSRARLMLYGPTRVLAAACLLIAVTAIWWFAVHRRAASRIEVVQEVGPTQLDQAAEAGYRPIRIVLSLPIRRAPVENVDKPVYTIDAEVGAHAMTAALRADRSFLARMDRAFSAGDIQNTLDLLDGASDDQRTAAYQHMGELLRSAYVAEQILDRLSPREQLAVCNHWAKEPSLRPVVFSRVERFSKQPELSDSVQALIAGFAENPTLLTWLRGYQLIGRTLPGEGTPG